MKTFTTQVNGTPCQCQVIHYRPFVPAKLDGPPESCYPSEPSEFEFDLLDMDGNPAPALEDLVTPEVCHRLQDEYEAAVMAAKHGEDF